MLKNYLLVDKEYFAVKYDALIFDEPQDRSELQDIINDEKKDSTWTVQSIIRRLSNAHKLTVKKPNILKNFDIEDFDLLYV